MQKSGFLFVESRVFIENWKWVFKGKKSCKWHPKFSLLVYDITFFSQVSSIKSTTKLSRILIHHPRSTVILCRWILIDRRYRLYSPVGESLSTVDIDRDRSTGSINRWIGIVIQIHVGTISHHSWDHDSFVDVYPGPFLITSGTIWDHKSWSFFFGLLGKTRPGQKAKRLKRHTRKRKWAGVHPEGRVMHTWQSPSGWFGFWHVLDV